MDITKRAGPAPILIVCSDPVLVLDLQMLLDQNGLAADIEGAGPAQRAEGDPCYLAAIIDLEEGTHVRQRLRDLARAGIPVITLGAVTEQLPGANVIGSHLKPVSVDDLLPAVLGAGRHLPR